VAYIELPKTHYTPAEVGGLVGRSRQWVVSQIRAGAITAQQTSGGHWRIPIDAVKGVEQEPVEIVGTAVGQ
jgi:excisionase family DNA binding protein